MPADSTYVQFVHKTLAHNSTKLYHYRFFKPALESDSDEGTMMSFPENQKKAEKIAKK